MSLGNKDWTCQADLLAEGTNGIHIYRFKMIQSRSFMKVPFKDRLLANLREIHPAWRDSLPLERYWQNLKLSHLVEIASKKFRVERVEYCNPHCCYILCMSISVWTSSYGECHESIRITTYHGSSVLHLGASDPPGNKWQCQAQCQAQHQAQRSCKKIKSSA